MLINKNNSYGDSALHPLRVFSRADPIEAIKVRIDDKLSRLTRGNGEDFHEDTIDDLMGYLVLLKIARERRRLEAEKIVHGSPPDNPVASLAATQLKKVPVKDPMDHHDI